MMNMEERIKKIEREIEEIKQKLGLKEKTFTLDEACNLAEKYLNRYYRGFMHELDEAIMFDSKKYALVVYKINIGGLLKRLTLIVNSEQGVIDERIEPYGHEDSIKLKEIGEK